MADALTVNPVPANYPIVITVCLSLLGTTVLTWCFGKMSSSQNPLITQRSGQNPLSHGVHYLTLDGVSFP